MDCTNVKFPGCDTVPVTQNITTGDYWVKCTTLYTFLQVYVKIQLYSKKPQPQLKRKKFPK